MDGELSRRQGRDYSGTWWGGFSLWDEWRGLQERLVVASDELCECFWAGLSLIRLLTAEDVIFILLILVSNGNFILKLLLIFYLLLVFIILSYFAIVLGRFPSLIILFLSNWPILPTFPCLIPSPFPCLPSPISLCPNSTFSLKALPYKLSFLIQSSNGVLSSCLGIYNSLALKLI